MNQLEYFRNKVATCLSCLSNSALNAGADAVGTIVAFEIATPYTPRDYQNALTAWLQGRHHVWQSRIDAYETNPTDENLATIARLTLGEHLPHTQQDFDDIVATAYSLAVNETLIENEIEKRKNNGE
jgi:hypothetical protein